MRYNSNMTPTIAIDSNIELRAANPNCAAAKIAAATRSRDQLLPWLDWIKFYDAYETDDEKIQAMGDYQASKVTEFERGTNYTYDIFYDGEYAGSIEIMHINNANKFCEIGYWLAVDFMRKGIMTKAVNVITELAFEKLGMHCVIILAAAKNARSCAVAERCGFKLDATLRSRLLINGEYTDENVYSKLEEE